MYVRHCWILSRLMFSNKQQLPNIWIINRSHEVMEYTHERRLKFLTRSHGNDDFFRHVYIVLIMGTHRTHSTHIRAKLLFFLREIAQERSWKCYRNRIQGARSNFNQGSGSVLQNSPDSVSWILISWICATKQRPSYRQNKRNERYPFSYYFS